jgi:uncharacterized membrane protein YfcA
MPAWLPPDLLAAIAIVFGAGLLRGFSGFGSAMIMSASLSAVFGPAVAIPMIIALETVIGLQLLPGARTQVHWRTVACLSLPAVLALPIGALALTSLDAEVTRYLISGLILAFIGLLAIGFRNPNPPRPLGSALVGGIGGVTTGALGIGGPPVVLYFLTGPDAAARIRANLIHYFLFLDFAAIAVFAVKGLYGEAVLIKTVILLPAFALGTFVGQRFFKGTSDRLYRQVAMAIVAATAVVSLFA